jgi:GTP cyclohydrolase II
MDQYYFSSLKPSSKKEQHTQSSLHSECINSTVCEKNREACNELIESKIKLSVLNLKLWIVTSIVLFLVSTGGTFVCAIRSYGKIEQRVDTITENQKALETSVESLRQEIWKLIPTGRYRTTAPSSLPSTENRNDESNEAFNNGTVANASR